MSLTSEIHVDAQAPARASMFRAAGSLGRRWVTPHLTRPMAAVAEPAGRISFQPTPVRPPAHQRQALTVISANLWHDWPWYRRLRQRLEDFAQLVEAEHADVVLLQEVARTSHLRVDEWLAQRLGMAYVYSRANGHEAEIGFEEGLAVFSRFPLRGPRLRHLSSSNPFVRRLALGAEIETPFGGLHAFSAHLGLTRRQNARQLAHLRAWVTETAGESMALIGGDFNAPERSAQITRAQQGWLDTFRHLHPHVEAVTHEVRWPWGCPLLRQRLDYVFLHRGAETWHVLEARHRHSPNGPYSDHHAVVVRLAPHIT